MDRVGEITPKTMLEGPVARACLLSMLYQVQVRSCPFPDSDMVYPSKLCPLGEALALAAPEFLC